MAKVIKQAGKTAQKTSRETRSTSHGFDARTLNALTKDVSMSLRHKKDIQVTGEGPAKYGKTRP